MTGELLDENCSRRTTTTQTNNFIKMFTNLKSLHKINGLTSIETRCNNIFFQTTATK